MRYRPNQIQRIYPTALKDAFDSLSKWIYNELVRVSGMQDGEDRIAYLVDTPSYGHIEGGALPSSYYYAGLNRGTALTTGAPTANVLRAFPFIAPNRDASISQIAFNVTTLLAGNARIGIYDTISNTNLYPDNCLADSGNISTGSTGVKTFNCTIQTKPSALYWLAMVSSAAPTLRCAAVDSSSVPGLLPDDASMPTTRTLGLSVGYVFTALPSKFPSSAAFINAIPIPVLAYRFGA